MLVCNKDGYQEATFLVHSGFEATTVGNVFIGGLIGVGIDAATGANNHYDSPVNITFVPGGRKCCARPGRGGAGFGGESQRAPARADRSPAPRRRRLYPLRLPAPSHRRR